jgi:hypothetical protein
LASNDSDDVCRACPEFWARPGNVGDEEPPEPVCHRRGRCPEIEPSEEELEAARERWRCPL